MAAQRETLRISPVSSTAVNSFGTLLETIQRATSSNREANDLQSRLLRVIAQKGPTSIADLVAVTGAKLSEVLQDLRVLKEFGLVNLVGSAGEERVAATKSGESTASAIK